MLVQATYTYANPSELVDQRTLIAARWVLVGLVNEDGQGFSGTWFLYMRQGAWITWGGTTQEGALGVWAGEPVHDGPIGCGKTLRGDASQQTDIPLPQDTASVAVFRIAPYCLRDVESFYATTLPAAGWVANGPFQIAASADGSVSTASATFSRNGVSLHLSLTGADGTSTDIATN